MPNPRGGLTANSNANMCLFVGTPSHFQLPCRRAGILIFSLIVLAWRQANPPTRPTEGKPLQLTNQAQANSFCFTIVVVVRSAKTKSINASPAVAETTAAPNNHNNADLLCLDYPIPCHPMPSHTIPNHTIPYHPNHIVLVRSWIGNGWEGGRQELVGGLVSFNINHKINNRKVTAPAPPTSWPQWVRVAICSGIGKGICRYVSASVHLELHLDAYMDVGTSKAEIEIYTMSMPVQPNYGQWIFARFIPACLGFMLLYLLVFSSFGLSLVQLFCRFHVCVLRLKMQGWIATLNFGNGA